MLKLLEQLIPTDPQYSTVAEAASFYRIGKNTIYRALANREIYHHCIGRKKLIKRTEIEKWLRKRSRNVIDRPRMPLTIVSKNKSPNTTPDDRVLNDRALDDIISFVDNNFDFEGSDTGIGSDYRIDIDDVCEFADGRITCSVTKRLAS